jgi:hypothetical protein
MTDKSQEEKLKEEIRKCEDIFRKGKYQEKVFCRKSIKHRILEAELKGFQAGLKEGRKAGLKEVKELIEKERDNGNVSPKGFSAGICLSNLLKFLEGEKSQEELDYEKECEEGKI